MENRGTSCEPKSVQGGARTVLDLVLPQTTSTPRPNSSVAEADFVPNKGRTAKTSLGWQGIRGSRAPRAGCSETGRRTPSESSLSPSDSLSNSAPRGQALCFLGYQRPLGSGAPSSPTREPPLPAPLPTHLPHTPQVCKWGRDWPSRSHMATVDQSDGQTREDLGLAQLETRACHLANRCGSSCRVPEVDSPWETCRGNQEGLRGSREGSPRCLSNWLPDWNVKVLKPFCV